MSDAPRRPRLRRRLERARSAGALVRIERRIPGAEPVDGFVVATGAGWLLLARYDSLVALDGWTALPVADLAGASGVTTLAGPDDFEVRALRLRGSWPPRLPDGEDAPRLDDARDVLRLAARLAPLATVHREREQPDACWIGAVRKVGPRRATLLLVDPSARWDGRPTRFDLGDLTRVDAGGGYEDALHLVAGDPPT